METPVNTKILCTAPYMITDHWSLILSNSSSPFPHDSHLKLNNKSPFKTDGDPDLMHSVRTTKNFFHSQNESIVRILHHWINWKSEVHIGPSLKKIVCCHPAHDFLGE